MKVVIVSDLHVDICGQLPLPYMEGNVLVIAGDTANSAKADARQTNELAKNFDHVVCVDGNHTHYSNSFHNPKIDTIEHNNQYMKSMLANNATMLDFDSFLDYEGYRFVGNNGWYSCDYRSDIYDLRADTYPFWKTYMNDYKCIWENGSMKQPLPHMLAAQDSINLRASIEAALDEKQKPFVVTHTLPHKSMLTYKPWDHTWERLSTFYWNSGNQLIMEEYGSKISNWVCGHSHVQQYKKINGIECYLNPRGYPSEYPNWKPLELDL